MARPRFSWMTVFLAAGLALAAWRACFPPAVWVAGRTMEQTPRAVTFSEHAAGLERMHGLSFSFRETQGALFRLRSALSFEPRRPMALAVGLTLRDPLPVGVYRFDSQWDGTTETLEQTSPQIAAVTVSDALRSGLRGAHVVGSLHVECATPAALAGHLTLESTGDAAPEPPTDWSGRGPVRNGRWVGGIDAELSVDFQSTTRTLGVGCHDDHDCCGLRCEAGACAASSTDEPTRDAY